MDKEIEKTEEIDSSKVSSETASDLIEDGVITEDEREEYENYSELSLHETKPNKTGITDYLHPKFIFRQIRSGGSKMYSGLKKCYQFINQQSYGKIESIDAVNTSDNNTIELIIVQNDTEFEYQISEESTLISNLVEYHDVEHPIKLENKKVPKSMFMSKHIFPRSVSLSGSLLYAFYSHIRGVAEPVRQMTHTIAKIAGFFASAGLTGMIAILIMFAQIGFLASLVTPTEEPIFPTSIEVMSMFGSIALVYFAVIFGFLIVEFLLDSAHPEEDEEDEESSGYNRY